MAHENTVSAKPVIPTRQFLDAADKNVSAVVVYLNTEDSKYYYNTTFTKEVKAADMLHLFFNGVVLLKEGTYYKAVSCTTAGVIDFGL